MQCVPAALICPDSSRYCSTLQNNYGACVVDKTNPTGFTCTCAKGYALDPQSSSDPSNPPCRPVGLQCKDGSFCAEGYQYCDKTI